MLNDPIQVGPIELKSRLVMPPMMTGLSRNARGTIPR